MKYFGAGGRPRSARGIFDGIFNLHQLVKRRGLYAPIDAQLVIRVKCQRPTPAIRAIGMLHHLPRRDPLRENGGYGIDALI